MSIQDGTKLYGLQMKYLKNVQQVWTRVFNFYTVQLRTVMAWYEQEIDQARAAPSCQRLKTVAKRHMEQMIRTRNFRARNERIETGVSAKSHGRSHVGVERRIGKCYQWKATGQCSRGDSCSFSHGSDRAQHAQSSSPAPKTQAQIDGRKLPKGIRSRADSPS